MSAESDGDLMDFAVDEASDSGQKRRFDEAELLESIQNLTREEIAEMIGIVKKHNTNKSPQITPEIETDNFEDNEGFQIACSKKRKTKTNQENTAYTGQQNLGAGMNYTAGRFKNYSPRMKELQSKEYNNLFYINTTAQLTRIQMADVWESARPKNSDVILKTKKGFLLKTNTPKTIVNLTLKKLQTENKIKSFCETAPYHKASSTSKIPTQSYSGVMASVEQDISELQIANHLKDININVSYCRRITSRKTNQLTGFIRINTQELASYEKLINEGVFYKNRHYAVYPSQPPQPAPMPCSKCLKFTHRTEDCRDPVECLKCRGKHPTNKCQSEAPPKCCSCGAEDHQAWSFQCPNRPIKPIQGIPNLPVKTLNKKSRQVSTQVTKDSRIHSAITIHDVIVNTYVEKLNKPSIVNREELIIKLRKRFIREYNVETAVNFVGNNWVYILMFDLENNNNESPTEIIPGNNVSQVRAQI